MTTVAVPVGAARASAEAADLVDSQRAARGAALTLFGTIAGAFANFAMLALIARAYGTEGFGSFSGVTAFFLAVTMITRVGADMGATWYVARLRAQNNLGQARLVMRVAAAPVLACSVALATALYLLVNPLADLLSDDAGRDMFVQMLQIVIVAIPLASVGEVLLGATRGYGDMRPTVIASQLGRQVGQLLLVVVAAVLSDDLRLLALAWVVPYVGTVVHPWLWLRGQPRTRRGRRGTPWGEFWRYSGPQGANQTAQIGLEKFDIIIIGPLAGLAAQGAYNGANRLAHLVVLAWYAINLAHGPVWARLFEQRRHVEVARSAQAVTAWAALLVGPVLWAFVLFGDVFTWLLGANVERGGTALAILAGGLLFVLPFGPCENLLLMAGRSGRSFINNLIALTVNIVLNLVLIPRYGTIGAAVAWAAAIAVVRGLATRQLWRSHRVAAWSWPLLQAWATGGLVIGGGGLVAREVVGNNVAGLGLTLLVGGPVLAAAALTQRDRFELGALVSSLLRRPANTAATPLTEAAGEGTSLLARSLDAPHLEFRIRSRVAVATPLTAGRLRLLLDAVPPAGWRGRVVRRIVAAVAVRFPAKLHSLPLLSLRSSAPVPIERDTLRTVLADAEARLANANATVRARPDGVLWLLPPGTNEPRLGALLLEGDLPVAHLRVRDEPTRSAKPWPRTGRGERSGVEWPMLIDRWYVGDLCCELSTVLLVGRHRPAQPTDLELHALAQDLQDTLAGGSPEVLQPGFVPMHGDLTPWNLRRTVDGRTVLFDWEHANYGPPYADLVRYYATSRHGLKRFEAMPIGQRGLAAAAISFWMHVASGRAAKADGKWKRRDRRREWQRLADLQTAATGQAGSPPPAAMVETKRRTAPDEVLPAGWPTSLIPAVRRYRRLVQAAAVLGMAAALLAAFPGWRTHEAPAEVVLRDPWLIDPAVTVRPVGGDYERFVRLQREFLTNDTVIDTAAALSGDSPADFRTAVVVGSDPRGLVLTLSTRGGSAASATLRRDALLEAYSAQRRAALAAVVQAKTDAIDAEAGLSPALDAEAAELRARVTEYGGGVAYTRLLPARRVRSTADLGLLAVTGAAGGAAAGMTAAWVLAARRSPAELLRLNCRRRGIELLGELPPLDQREQPGLEHQTAVAVLAAQLRLRPQHRHGGRVVLVTGMREATTRMTAQLLAVAARSQGTTTWTVPGDLRGPDWPQDILALPQPGELVLVVCPHPAVDAAGLHLAPRVDSVLLVVPVATSEKDVAALAGAFQRTGSAPIRYLAVG